MGNLDSTTAPPLFPPALAGTQDAAPPLPPASRDSRATAGSGPSFADLISRQGDRPPAPSTPPARPSGAAAKSVSTPPRSRSQAPTPDSKPSVTSASQEASAASSTSQATAALKADDGAAAPENGDANADAPDGSQKQASASPTVTDQQLLLAGLLATMTTAAPAAPTAPAPALSGEGLQEDSVDPMTVGGVGTPGAGCGSAAGGSAKPAPSLQALTGQNKLVDAGSGRNLPPNLRVASGAAWVEGAAARTEDGKEATPAADPVSGVTGGTTQTADGGSPVVASPAPAAPADPALGVVADGLGLRARVLMGSRGTSTAQVEGVMKTDSSQTAASQPTTGGTSSASAGTPAVPVAAPQGGGSHGFSGSRDDREGAANARTPAAVSAAAGYGGAVGSAQGFATEVSQVGVSQGPGSVTGVEALRDEIQARAVEVRAQGLSSMTVVLRPDPSTELAIQLRSTGDRVEVHVRVERGDSTALQGQWNALQESLSQRGVSLSALETAPLPALPPASHPNELRADPAGMNLAGVTDARLAGVSSMNFSTGQDTRDQQGRSGGSADAFAASLADGSGARGGAFGGSHRSPADSDAGFGGAFDTGGRPGARTGAPSAPSRTPVPSRPAASTGSAGGPWESWA